MAGRPMLLPSRFPDAQPLPGPIALPSVDLAETVEPSRRRILLPWAVKLCLMVALVGFGASQYLSWMIGAATMQRDTRIARGLDDPETTGSIASQARGVAIDPCAASLTLKSTR